jgi:hypothetical protein
VPPIPYPPRTEVPEEEVKRVDLGTMTNMSTNSPYISEKQLERV